MVFFCWNLRLIDFIFLKILLLKQYIGFIMNSTIFERLKLKWKKLINWNILLFNPLIIKIYFFFFNRFITTRFIKLKNDTRVLWDFFNDFFFWSIYLEMRPSVNVSIVFCSPPIMVNFNLGLLLLIIKKYSKSSILFIL